MPGASFLVLLGLYGFYLMWPGLPVLMKAPRDRALPYVLVVAACAIAARRRVAARADRRDRRGALAAINNDYGASST